MKVSVWDTYVNRPDGQTMHFDIIVPSTVTNPDTVFAYGKQYLNSKNMASTSLSTKECQFCHIEKATPEVVDSITTQGFFILEMEHCN